MKQYFVRYSVARNSPKYMIYLNYENEVYENLLEDIQKEILTSNGYNSEETWLVDIIAMNPL